tara:strand:- start:466 stop:1494 length:1029 start_codon:yes stop_codon:yes gene_type:complete
VNRHLPIGIIVLVLMVCVAAMLFVGKRSESEARRAERAADVAAAHAADIAVLGEPLESDPEFKHPELDHPELRHPEPEHAEPDRSPIPDTVSASGVRESVVPDEHPPSPEEVLADRISALLEELVRIGMVPDFVEDSRGVAVVDELMHLHESGLSVEDQARIVAAFDLALNRSLARPASKSQIYDAIAEALGRCGHAGAAVLLRAYTNKRRFKVKPMWEPLRGRLLRNIGRCKVEANVDFLLQEARRNLASPLQAAAGDALGCYERSPHDVREKIVFGLVVSFGTISELAEQGRQHGLKDAGQILLVIQGAWISTLRRLTGRDFTTGRAWAAWYRQNRGQNW